MPTLRLPAPLRTVIERLVGLIRVIPEGTWQINSCLLLTVNEKGRAVSASFAAFSIEQPALSHDEEPEKVERRTGFRQVEVDTDCVGHEIADDEVEFEDDEEDGEEEEPRETEIPHEFTPHHDQLPGYTLGFDQSLISAIFKNGS